MDQGLKPSSVSHADSRYVDLVKLAVREPMVFNNFRRMKEYMHVAEHTNKEFCLELHEAMKRPNIFDGITNYSWCDVVGSPILHNVNDKLFIGHEQLNLSAKAVKFRRIAIDLSRWLGDKINDMRIIEIGAGFGGQFITTSELFRCDWLFVDIECVVELIKKSIHHLVQSGWTMNGRPEFLAFESIEGMENAAELKERTFDLCFSFYGISECRRDVQQRYIDLFCKRSRFGFIGWNYVNGIDTMSPFEFMEACAIPGIRMYGDSEYNLFGVANLITWGKQWV